jgi:hypothetical protein
VPKRRQKLMWNVLKNTFVHNIITILHNRTFLVRILILFILLLSLRFVFPLFYGLIYSKTGFQPGSYFSLVAITLIMIIPLITGMANADALKNDDILHVINNHEGTDFYKIKYLLRKMIFPAFFSFILVMIAVILAKPVPAEGWLRTLFAGLLFSIQSSVVFLFAAGVSGRRFNGVTSNWIYGLFVIVVPLGLLLHHPWNYFSFFSPLYWIACSWLVRSPYNSMIYGLIALILTSAAILALLWYFMRKQKG